MEIKQDKAIYLMGLNQGLNEQNVNELYVEYKRKVYTIALSYVKDYYLAEDLSHEILIKCYLTRDKFKGDCSFHSWMYRISVNHCIDFLRKSYRKRDLLYEDINIFNSEDAYNPESEVLNLCDQEELRDHLRQLPSKYQEVIIHFYFKDQSLRDIVNELNINLSTAKTRLFRAKKMLREFYYM
ncbi:RNA polymerase sigma-70 factor, ECF subfamily [Salinibacillus kushneri]|uniref:RNA polymerase sigma-70 factor, ECF subfamily n=1 Tax=Salinibacillus kushneri TaxID=237682 RepID=A0A1I0DIS4_9BACI|nr:sigma-70 family RNA polymerase sigma factor [Salinibacillus kushneri]SET32338.1 RNA polymerase sigma-70 factor, ECF subfamily [Salinibacillus kushneri]